MARLIRTTLIEIASIADELELDDKLVFSTEDPDELEFYNMQPIKWNVIFKSNLMYENDYSIVIGLIDGRCTVAKDINILAEGNINDEDARIDGINDFLEEYYEKYMQKNKHGTVYLVVD